MVVMIDTDVVPRAIYEQERARRIAAEQERDHWKNEFYLMRKLRRAPVLKPIDKAIVEEFRHVEKWGQVKDADGRTRANFKTIARNLHTSPDTVKRHAERMERLGMVEIHEHQGVQDEYERKYIHIPEEKLRTVDQLEDPEKIIPKQGGDRSLRCMSCDAELETRTVTKKRKRTTLRCTNPNCSDWHREIVLEEDLDDVIEDTGWKQQNGQKTQKQHAFGEEMPASDIPKEQDDDPETQLADHCVDTRAIDVVPDDAEDSQKQVASTPYASNARSLAEPPEFLKNKRIWCCGRAEWNKERERFDKVPYIADLRGTEKASSTNPSTWRTYEYAKVVYEKSQSWKDPFNLLMFMCNGTFTFIDQDHCIDQQTGKIDPEAVERARRIDSYTEESWSGDGLHTYAIGMLPPGRRRIADIEMYDQARPCVFTGKHVAGFPTELEQRQEQIARLHAEVMPKASPEPLWQLPDEQARTDEEMEQMLVDLLEKASHAKNGEKFVKLWKGDTSDYNHDHSRADVALCRMIAYWTQKSVSTVDRLFRQSKLYRPKWERADYRERTLRYAFAEVMA